MATPYKLVAGMATMPSREHTAPRALRSLVGQFDTIHLVLNGYEQVPQWAQLPSVQVTLDHTRDYGAAGKLLGLALEADLHQSIYFCVDDDIHYPRNFAKTLAKFLVEHPGAMVGVHGSLITTPFTSWREDRRVFSGHRALLRARQVDVIATCGCAFFPQDLAIDARNWPQAYRNCVDLYLARLAAEREVERWIVSRYRGWMKPLEIKQYDSIYQQLLKDDSQHVDLARQLLALNGHRAW